MKISNWRFQLIWVVGMCALCAGTCRAGTIVKLPAPQKDGEVSVEKAMRNIRSHRQFSHKPLSLSHVSRILWAANGNIETDAITSATKKPLPSAGGLYPLEIFLVAGKDAIPDMDPGVFHYKPKEHVLEAVATGDRRHGLAMAALGQTWLAKAPALVVIAPVFPKTLVKYGKRGVNYVYMEVGASNQNIYLQATALGLKAASVGAFNDKAVHKRLGLPDTAKPALIVAIGY